MPYLLTIAFAFMSPDDAFNGPQVHYLEGGEYETHAQCAEEGQRVMHRAEEFATLEFSCDPIEVAAQR